MNEEPRTADAAQALADIQRRQQQVIDQAAIPGVHYPATLACLAGGIAMGLGGPVLMRTLRRIMLGNRAGSAR
jgi:hypothetical protein